MSWIDRRDNWQVQAEDQRTPYDVDYARIVHSGSFRRLQGKTQILNLGDSDFYRTRLTHSLEVAQIGAGIARQLNVLKLDNSNDLHPANKHIPPTPLIQSLGFMHDLGHPPFGHGGEVALQYCMHKNGGFEGNGQTLRILSKLENFSENHGANLTRRTLLGILKYPVPYSKVFNPIQTPYLDQTTTSIKVIDRKKSKPPKCYLDSENDVVEWIFENIQDDDIELFQEIETKESKHSKSKHKSFDCSIMDLADDIAYGVHDLEDAIALGLVIEKTFRKHITEEKCPSFLDALKAKYPSETANNVYEKFVSDLFANSGKRKHSISRLVHHFMTAVYIETLEEFKEPLFRYRAAMLAPQRSFLDALQDLVVDEVISSASVQHLEFKGQTMVVSVFEAISTDPKKLLPRDAFEKYEISGNDPRVICDYVAGMTDSYLLKTFDRLFSPHMGSVFDKL
jgi:dGTPase